MKLGFSGKTKCSTSNSEQLAIALMMALPNWNLEEYLRVASCSGLPGTKCFLACRTFSAKPREIPGKLGLLVTLAEI